MEPVTHACGAQLYHHESGGVSAIVVYSDDGQREIHGCPVCGQNLRDADLRDAGGKPVLPPPST